MLWVYLAWRRSQGSELKKAQGFVELRKGPVAEYMGDFQGQCLTSASPSTSCHAMQAHYPTKGPILGGESLSNDSMSLYFTALHSMEA